MTDTSHPRAEARGNTLSIIGVVCGAVAFLFLPIVLGPVGLVLGFVARSKGERLANVAIIVSALGLIVGMVLGYLVFTSTT